MSSIEIVAVVGIATLLLLLIGFVVGFKVGLAVKKPPENKS